ncbi:MAG: putative nucleotidyltransferase with HDIG domain [Bacteriovoracaceae bacterium]|jgi:putative nucleotidyltransferase with HDIG domain
MTYSKIPIYQINPDAMVPADIYLKLNDKYVKFKNSGENLTVEKYNTFMSKGIQFLYVLEKDYPKFEKWLNDKSAQEIEAFVTRAGEEGREAFKDAKKLEEFVYEVFSDQDLDLEKIDQLQSNVQDFVEKMRSNPQYSQALSMMVGRSNTIAAHSIAVGNLAVYISMSLGNAHQFALENIYLAAIFHDYGKLKIPEEVQNNPDHIDYTDYMLSHPENSVQIIRKSKGIPEQVIKMIQEHHEYWDGSGYPKGLKGESIYKNSPILCLANELEEFLHTHKNLSDIDRFQGAIELVQDGGATKWPPSFYPRIVEALKLGFISQRGLED